MSQSTIVLIVGVLLIAGLLYVVLSTLFATNSRAEDRLDRLGRPKSVGDLDDMVREDTNKRKDVIKDMIAGLGAGGADGKSELERSALRVRLANAGFRGEMAVPIFFGLQAAVRLGSLVPVVLYALYDRSQDISFYGIFGAVCFGTAYIIPSFVLDIIKGGRQKEIFLSLPDALDLMVVCVESGLGLDAAMRKVNDEMKEHAKVLCEELSVANMQLQMGRPRREVLHDLGVRTGVDDVRALAAILIQADRFGSSIAQALRVQSDSMRTRRRQIAEEKAAKTAVQLIFPLVLFIFPAIFVVLVGPAGIQIVKALDSTGIK